MVLKVLTLEGRGGHRSKGLAPGSSPAEGALAGLGESCLRQCPGARV